MSRTALLLSILLSIGACLATVSTASAQERFELGEDDTWLEVDPVDPASPEGQLRAIRRTLAQGRPERAKQLADEWLERHGGHPDAARAYLLRGDALVTLDDEYEALYDFELVARSYPGSEAFIAALERQLDIAKRYADGEKRKLWGIRMASAETEAEELLIRIQERLPGSSLAEEAALVLGDFYFRNRDMDLAAEMYDIFIENFPRSESIEIARQRLVYAHLAAFKGPEFDASGLRDAEIRLRELRAIAPATAQRMGAEALLARIDESTAHKLLVTAEWLEDTGDPIGAEYALRRLLREHPRTIAAVTALRRARDITRKLPPSVQQRAPDYEAIARELLGDGDAPKPPAGAGAGEDGP